MEEPMELVRELVTTLDTQIFEMMEEARRDIDRITGIADLDEVIRRGHMEARWRRYHEATQAIHEQRAAIVKLMVDLLAHEAPKPMLLPADSTFGHGQTLPSRG